MRILYLDTTTKHLYLAIIVDNKLLSEKCERLDNQMSVKTLPIIKKMLNDANLSIKDIDKIIVVNGPGSFTGTRIGLTIAKTIAWATKIPIVTISSLEAMAFSYKGLSNFVIPMIDARRDYVFTAIYDNENHNFVLKEQYISLNTLKVTLDSLGDDVEFISNDKINMDAEILSYTPNFLNIIEQIKDRVPINPHLVDANYLKLTEAEENIV